MMYYFRRKHLDLKVDKHDSFIPSKFDQLKTSFWKNWLFHRGNWKITLLQIFTPSLSVIIFAIFALLISEYNDVLLFTSPRNITPQTRCSSWNQRKCYTLLVYFYLSEDIYDSDMYFSCVKKILIKYSNESGLELERDIAIRNISDLDELAGVYTFLSLNPNVTDGIVVFLKCSLDVLNPILEYAIGYNGTFNNFLFSKIYSYDPAPLDLRYNIQLMINNIFLNLHYGKDLSIRLNIQEFPILSNTFSSTLLQLLAFPSLLFCGIAIHYPILLYFITYEREKKQREYLKLNGLFDSIYWFSWGFSEIFIIVLSFLPMLMIGYALGFKLYINTDLFVLFTLLTIFSISMVQFTFFVSDFISNVQQAIVFGILLLCLGMLVVCIFANNYIFAQLYSYAPVFLCILNIFPPVSFAKAIGDMILDSSNLDSWGFSKEIQYFGVSSLFHQRHTRVFNINTETRNNENLSIIQLPSTIYSFISFIIDTLLFIILHWYFDAFRQSNTRSFKSFFGLLFPFRCMLKRKLRIQEERFLSDHFQNSIICMNISKYYYSGIFEKNAIIDDLSFAISSNQVLVILGINGAGKSSLFNILNGLSNFDKGHVSLFGHDLRIDLDVIRAFSGYCLQYNALWDELTAFEHFVLYSSLKISSKEKRMKDIQFLIDALKLSEILRNKILTFSDGMKRRLNVALSFLATERLYDFPGDPKVIFLDEPTTGMDVMMRKRVWNLIFQKKNCCTFIMTTHCMYEAEIIADHIIIMKDGRIIRSDGKKNIVRDLSGFKLSFYILQDFSKVRESLKNYICQYIPIASMKIITLGHSDCTSMDFIIPKEHFHEMMQLCSDFDSPQNMFYENVRYELSYLSPEDPFLEIVGSSCD